MKTFLILLSSTAIGCSMAPELDGIGDDSDLGKADTTQGCSVKQDDLCDEDCGLDPDCGPGLDPFDASYCQGPTLNNAEVRQAFESDAARVRLGEFELFERRRECDGADCGGWSRPERIDSGDLVFRTNHDYVPAFLHLTAETSCSPDGYSFSCGFHGTGTATDGGASCTGYSVWRANGAGGCGKVLATSPNAHSGFMTANCVRLQVGLAGGNIERVLVSRFDSPQTSSQQ